MMVAELWNDCVEAACQAFDINRTKAKLFILGLIAWMGLMILQTWFIWVGVIAVLLAILAVLLLLECSLRAWYAMRDDRHPQASASRSSPQAPAVPEQLLVACADVQGRIEDDGLPGHDVDAMAEQILQKARVRKIGNPWPLWLSFPALCRAVPSLRWAGKAILAVLVK